MLSGDLYGSVGRSRIDDDEFVGDILYRGEALTQEAFLVLDDHADTQPGLPVEVRQLRPSNMAELLPLFAVDIERALQRLNHLLGGGPLGRESQGSLGGG